MAVFQCVVENVAKGISTEVLHCVCFSLSEESSKPDSDVRVMFSKSELLAYFTADDIMPFLLYEIADVLSFKTEGVQAAVSDLPFCKAFIFWNESEHIPPYGELYERNEEDLSK